MSLKLKRGILIISIVIITSVSYIIMNRNYDQLSRYPYELSESQRKLILENMNELEIKYIIDYSIAPGYFMDFINYYNFNAYYSELYYEAKNNLIYLNDGQIINVVNEIENKHLDFNECMNDFRYLYYDAIIESLD